MNRKGFTTVELVVIIVILALLMAIALPYVTRDIRAEARSRASCMKNLKQWATIFHLYAQESAGGILPPIESEPEIAIAPRIDAIFPHYTTDRSILSCGVRKPGDFYARNYGTRSGNGYTMQSVPFLSRGRPDDSYVYLGWVFDRLENVPEQEMQLSDAAPWLFEETKTQNHPRRCDASAYAGGMGGSGGSSTGHLPWPPWKQAVMPAQVTLAMEALWKKLAHGDGVRVFEDDIEIAAPHGNAGGTTLHRLAEGVERFLVTSMSDPVALKTAADIPVMLDDFSDTTPFPGFDSATFNHHIPNGCNVLFLDGHVEYVEYPKPPVTPPMGTALGFAACVLDGLYPAPASSTP